MSGSYQAPVAQSESDSFAPLASDARPIHRWWLLLPCAAVGFAIGLTPVAFLAPAYRTQLTLTAASDPAQLTAERIILQNADFQQRAATTLEALPHPAQVARGRWINRLTGNAPTRTLPYAQQLSDTARRTQVSLAPPNLQLTCESSDPDLAASWCNTLAGNLLNQNQLQDTRTPASQPVADASAANATAEPSTANVPPVNISPAVVHTLQQALIDTQTEERVRALSGDTDAYNAALHREKLLQISFNSAIRRLTLAQREAAQSNLLHQEVQTSARRSDLRPGAPAAIAANPKQMEFGAAHISQAAAVPPAPLPPHFLPGALAGTSIGLAFGAVLIFSLPRKSDVASEEPAPEAAISVPQLGAIPDLHHYVESNPYDPFQIIAYSLLLEEWNRKSPDGAVRSYAIASPHPGAGKTVVAANLGIALANQSLRVLLLDANLTNPELHLPFDLSNSSGLDTLLSNKRPLNRDTVQESIRPTAYPNLFLLPTGRTDRSLNLFVQQIASTVAGDFDLLIVDLPSLDSPGAFAIAAQCQATILILPAGAESVELSSTLNQLDTRNIRVAGMATNRPPHAANQAAAA